jgi:hypothetical protein
MMQFQNQFELVERATPLERMGKEKISPTMTCFLDQFSWSLRRWEHWQRLTQLAGPYDVSLASCFRWFMSCKTYPG